MKFPIIKIRDKGSNDEGYYLGFDERHHELILDDNGNLQFFNIQCNDGTGKDGGFEFISKEDGFGKEVEFGNIYDLIEINKNSLLIQDKELLEKYEIIVNQLKEVFSKAEKAKKERFDNILKCEFEDFD